MGFVSHVLMRFCLMTGKVGFIFIILLLVSCYSGKEAYNRGDYYEAVIQAVGRLRESPDHKTATEILKLSYPLAVEHLEFDSKNQISIDAGFKYNKILQNHQKINTLYDEIKRSPAALRIIPDPINKYDEIAALKKSAAEEAYNAGIQELLKDTREDAKKAYYLFQKANTLLSGYKEAVDMARQAKINATLSVVVEPDIEDKNGWNFKNTILSVRHNEFVRFYPWEQIGKQELEKVHQSISVQENQLFTYPTSLTKTKTHFSDSVKVDDVKVKDKTYPKYKKITASFTLFEKEIKAKGTIVLAITDWRTNEKLLSTEIDANARWNASWGTYSGDFRALPNYAKTLCKKHYDYRFMPADHLSIQIKKNLDYLLTRKLESFYSKY